MKKSIKVLVLIFCVFFCVSCIGISTDISMKKNGSGRIALEYRHMRRMENIGRLDGNENWPIIPVGKRDMERTAARIEGIRLVSYSSRETASKRNAEKDILTKVALDFSTVRALLEFLDPVHDKTSFVQNGDLNTLNIILFGPSSSWFDPDLMNLLRDISEGYQFKFSFSADKNASLSFTNGSGRAIAPPPEAQITQSGKKVSFVINTTDFFNYPQGLGIIISW